MHSLTIVFAARLDSQMHSLSIVFAARLLEVIYIYFENIYLLLKTVK